jgi:hypothetical protein
MEVAEMDEALKVLDSSLSLIKWRLKFSTNHRLEIGSFPFSSPLKLFLSFFFSFKLITALIIIFFQF